MDWREEDSRPPRLAPARPNPTGHPTRSVYFVHGTSSNPSMSSSSLSSDSNTRLQHEIAETQSRVFDEINAYRMSFGGERANGLATESLALRNHAAQHVPHRNSETFESVRDNREQVKAQTSALDAFEQDPNAALRLDRARRQRSDETYQETVKMITKFLKTNPSAIVDLQAQGFAFEPESSARPANAGNAVQGVNQRCSVEVSHRTREQESLLDERAQTINSLRSQMKESEKRMQELEADNLSVTTELQKTQTTHRTALINATEGLRRQVTVLRGESRNLQDEITRKNIELERQKRRTQEIQKTADDYMSRAENVEGAMAQLRSNATESQRLNATRIVSLINDLDMARESVQDLTVAVQAHIRESANFSEPFLPARRQPSAIVHGLTQESGIIDVRKKSMEMFVACHHVPCKLELEDVYGIDRRLNEASHSDRTSALLLLLAILKIRVNKLQASDSKSFAASMFVLHIMHTLCAWSGPELVASLRLKYLFEEGVKHRLDNSPIVNSFAAMLVELLEGHHGLSFGASLRYGNLPNTIEKGGFGYIKVAESLLICTPEDVVVYVHGTQYAAEVSKYHDNVALLSFRLVFDQLPRLGHFKSVWWVPDFGDARSSELTILKAAMQRAQSSLGTMPPSLDTLRLVIE